MTGRWEVVRQTSHSHDETHDTGAIELPPSLWPTKTAPRRIRPFHWQWQVTDQQTGEVLAGGRAWTERRAWRREDRAAVRIYTQREADQTGTDQTEAMET